MSGLQGSFVASTVFCACSGMQETTASASLDSTEVGNWRKISGTDCLGGPSGCTWLSEERTEEQLNRTGNEGNCHSGQVGLGFTSDIFVTSRGFNITLSSFISCVYVHTYACCMH